jgi:hypothetical protein
MSCAGRQGPLLAKPDLEISEINPNKKTAITKQNLLHLAQVYHLEPLFFSKKIQIVPNARPSSHPVITLDTKYFERPNKLLAQWLHEEFHWWATLNPEKIKAAILDLKRIYPELPKEKQTKDILSSYSHLIICYLEHAALVHYLGDTQARTIITDFMRKDRLWPWTYFQVLNKNHALKQIVEKHGLVPPPLH